MMPRSKGISRRTKKVSFGNTENNTRKRAAIAERDEPNKSRKQPEGDEDLITPQKPTVVEIFRSMHHHCTPSGTTSTPLATTVEAPPSCKVTPTPVLATRKKARIQSDNKPPVA